jgi:hypothetical protein
MKVDDGGGVEEGASVNNNEILPGHVPVCLRRADVVSNGSDYEAPVATSATHCCLLCTMMYLLYTALVVQLSLVYFYLLVSHALMHSEADLPNI